MNERDIVERLHRAWHAEHWPLLDDAIFEITQIREKNGRLQSENDQLNAEKARWVDRLAAEQTHYAGELDKLRERNSELEELAKAALGERAA